MEAFSQPERETKDMTEVYLRLEREGGAQVQELSNQLKSVLEADQAQELKGGFRSGKRLDIKKVISYIASNYRKDKIWLRRSEPEKRNFQVLIGIDDSLSMSNQSVGPLALQSMMVLGLALQKLEVGQIGIASITNQCNMLLDFH